MALADKPMLGGCCVCLDERGWAENPLVYCDGQSCNVAVHQACYGIIKVPSGPWFCRKCESQERAAKVKCELCPHRDGALKRTDSAGWAHVVCALYIPEVTFGSVSSMEPIVLQKVPTDRFSKSCFICEEENRLSKATSGACMSCAKMGCKTSFHVTCAQMSGLLCEEASGGHQTKYCGYCKVHLPKGRKTMPVYKNLSSTKVYKLPITSSSDEVASPEKAQFLPETSVMKPGDIRYTKAGKKRTKSLEESLAVTSSKVNQQPDTTKVLPEDAPSPQNQESKSKETKTPDQQAETVQISASESGSKTVLPLETDVSVVTSSSTASGTSQPIAQGETVDSSVPLKPIPDINGANSHHGANINSTLPLLLETTESQAPVVGEDVTHTEGKSEKKKKRTTKESSQKKKIREVKKPRARKANSSRTKKDKTPLSGFIPCRPEPPPLTTDDPVTSPGTALYPRHSIVSLDNMGAERTETYEAHEIGDNNKVYKPDLSVDGVTAVERIVEEQRKDAMEFFRQYGVNPEVSALMEALWKVKEDNRHLEGAIKHMSHRRDQLLLIRSVLQAHTINAESTSSTQPSVSEQSQETALSSPRKASDSSQLKSPDHSRQSNS